MPDSLLSLRGALELLTIVATGGIRYTVRRTHSQRCSRVLAVGRRILAALPLVLVTAGTAFACPVCNTETGATVRAGIFNAEFAPTLLATLSPFPVILSVVAALHYGWTPAMWKRNAERGPEETRQ